MQHQQPSLFPADGIQSASQQYIPSVGGASSNQLWNLARAPNAQVQRSNPATQAPQDVSRSNHKVSATASQPSSGDVKSTGRSELPAFLPMAASSQGALPNVRPPSGLVRTSSVSSLGAPSSAWMPLQASSYSSGLPLQVPTRGNKFLVAYATFRVTSIFSFDSSIFNYTFAMIRFNKTN